jgi:hypothetical protein
VAVGLSWTRARASNPRVGQGWAHPFCPRGLDGFGFLSGRVGRVRVLVRRVGSDRHTCPSGTQPVSRLIQKSRIGWPTLGLDGQVCPTGWAEQAILSEPEPWASSGVLTLGLGFGFCPSGWVGLKKSVRTQLDGHTIINEMLQSINNYFVADKFIFERLDQRLCEQFELNSILHYSLSLNNEYEENELMICSIDLFNDDQWFAIFKTDWIKIVDILRHQNVLFLHTTHAKIIFIKISYISKTNDVQFLKNVSIMNESLFDI